MKKRERLLALITVAIVCGVLVYQFGLSGSGGGGEGAAQDDLGQARATFHEYVDTIKAGKQIRSDYEAIAFGVKEPGGGLTPSAAFQYELSDLLTKTMNIPAPQIQPSHTTEIDNVTEYYFVDAKVDVDGTLKDLVNLMKKLESRGVLIKDFTLVQGGRRNRDSSSVTMTVSRLAKTDGNQRPGRGQ